MFRCVIYIIFRENLVLPAQNHQRFKMLLCMLHWLYHRIQNTYFCRFTTIVTVIKRIFTRYSLCLKKTLQIYKNIKYIKHKTTLYKQMILCKYP